MLACTTDVKIKDTDKAQTVYTMLIVATKEHYETAVVIINAMVVVSGMFLCENCANLCGETEMCDKIGNNSSSNVEFGLRLGLKVVMVYGQYVCNGTWLV